MVDSNYYYTLYEFKVSSLSLEPILCFVIFFHENHKNYASPQNMELLCMNNNYVGTGYISYSPMSSF